MYFRVCIVFESSNNTVTFVGKYIAFNNRQKLFAKVTIFDGTAPLSRLIVIVTNYAHYIAIKTMHSSTGFVEALVATSASHFN